VRRLQTAPTDHLVACRDLAVRVLLQPLTKPTSTLVRAVREGRADLRSSDGRRPRHLRELLRAACGHLRRLRADTLVPVGHDAHSDVSSLRSPDELRSVCALRAGPAALGSMGRRTGVRTVLHLGAAPPRHLCRLWHRPAPREPTGTGRHPLL